MRTLTICTDAFLTMADLEKRALGMPDLGIAVIEHPLMYRTPEQLELLADEVMPVLERHFVTGAP